MTVLKIVFARNHCGIQTCEDGIVVQFITFILAMQNYFTNVGPYQKSFKNKLMEFSWFKGKDVLFVTFFPKLKPLSMLYCGGPAILLQHTGSLVQWVNYLLPVQGVSSLHPGDAQNHNGTGLLALSRYIGDCNMIDHWPHPRLRADNGKLHQALCRHCEKPAVTTHCLPRFHYTSCRSSSSSLHSDQLEPWSSCWGGALWRPCNFTPTQSHQSSGSTVCFPSRGSAIRILGMHKFRMELGFSCQCCLATVC